MIHIKPFFINMGPQLLMNCASFSIDTGNGCYNEKQENGFVGQLFFYDQTAHCARRGLH